MEGTIKMKALRPVRTYAFAAALATLTLASATPTLAQSPTPGGTLTIAVTSEPTAFDPHYGTGYSSDMAMTFTHEDLVRVNEGSDPVPLLATSWETVDPTTWEFRLREGAKFHDGTEFNAEDVAWYFNFSLDPANETAWRTEIAPIIESVKAVDTYTVRFNLKKPQASFPVLLASWAVGTGIKSPDAWAKNGKDVSLRTPVGTGPYILTEWSRGDRYEFRRNPDYWREGLPYVENIVVRIIPESSVQVAALLAGEVDIIQTTPRHEVSRLRAEGMEIVTASGWQQEMLWMNNLKPPFDNANVRKAIAKAIDRDRIVDTLFFGTATVASAGIPPGHWAFEEGLTGTSYDVEAAKALLAEAGYPDGFETEILTSNRQPEFKAEAELIQQMLAEIGIRTQIRLLELGAWWDVVLAQPYEYGLVLGEYSLAPDPHDFLWLNLRSDGEYALSRPQNPELDELLDQGRNTSDQAKRAEIYRQIHRIVDREVPILYILHRQLIYATRPEVRDFTLTGSGYIYPAEIWLDR